jgi:carboxypeptidase PM20D1
MSLWVIAVSLAALAIIIVIAFVAARTASFKSTQTDAPAKADYALDVNGAAARLAEAVTFKTVSSHDRSQFDYSQFSAFQAFLGKSSPLAHSAPQKQVVNSYGEMISCYIHLMIGSCR